jgi:hypothetical protein
MVKVQVALLALFLACNVPIQAQGLGGLFGGKEKPSPTEKAGPGAEKAMDLDGLLLQGGKLLAFSTIATELGYQASQKMLEAFPEETVKDIKALAEKVEAAKKANSSKDGNLDSATATAVSDYEKAFAPLVANWKTYKKDKAKVVVPAYGMVGLMVAADGVAALSIPEFLNRAKAALSSAGSNPFQLGKIKAATALVSTLGIVAQQIPVQIEAGKNVRTIAKNIAAAENFKLGEAPAITSPDPDALKKLAESSALKD